MIFLWTDILFWGLAIFSLVWYLRARKNPYWREIFLEVRSSRMAMMSFILICFYIFIALIDSIHFRNSSGSVSSLLDVFLAPLVQGSEKSYSAPLALKSFFKSPLPPEQGGGFSTLPLQYAGKSAWVSNHTLDIFLRVIVSLFVAILAVLAFRYFKRPQRSYLIFTFCFVFSLSLFFFLSLNYHVFGTDKTGTDVLYTSLKSIRTGLIIGTLTTIIIAPFALLLGIAAGYFGGIVDDIIQYLYTTLSSIPSILLIAAVMLIVQSKLSAEESVITADRRLFYLCVIMGITSWTSLARLIRGETLKLREMEFIAAAKVMGISSWKITIKHLAPNVLHLMLISIILQFSSLVLAEAVLAYVGIGVDPSMQSWGNMINSARLELARDPAVWWNLAAAFFFMLGLVLPANLFADVVRDALDPKLRGQQK
ncbi:MAG: ABC transporter permease [Candidatus Hydrogenedentota bacterium]|nr:MAG: ABC transporter permease [Candidatus Hydrogenedentota bacterium]